LHVLVIGGTLFIGPYVVRELARLGHAVTVYHRGKHEAALPESVRHVRSPLAAMPVVSFPSGIFGDAIDVVIHMIAMGEADARAARDAFSERVKRLVAVSSGGLCGLWALHSSGKPDPSTTGY
jgi:nucleoside-diphosphate-sugar epimerase